MKSENFSAHVASLLVAHGIKNVFVVPGGGNMFLVDACFSQPGLTLTFCHNEQTAAIAAEAAYKATGAVACCLVTSGPGSTNAITGITGAWLDSSPLLVLAGQVKVADLKSGSLRQKGPQEVAFIDMINKVSIYSHQLLVADTEAVSNGLALLQSPRPGPVVLVMPVDVQNSVVFAASAQDNGESELDGHAAYEVLDEAKWVAGKIEVAKRPVFLIGEGCRRVPVEVRDKFFNFCESRNIPCMFSWLSYDFLAYDSEVNLGRPGSVAKRHSNLIVQCCDLLVVIGSRLDPTQTAFRADNFASEAEVIVVDVDQSELEKHPKRFNRIQCDSRLFFPELLAVLESGVAKNFEVWNHFCSRMKQEFSDETSGVASTKGELSTEQVVAEFSASFQENDVIVTGSSGLVVEIFHLGFQNKTGQRVFLTTALGSMGFGIPSAIGSLVTLKNSNQNVYLVESDGSLMMNLQDLATLRNIDRPVTIFCINNQGYSSIRSSQRKHFGKVMGADAGSGLWFPDFSDVAAAFRFEYVSISRASEISSLLSLRSSYQDHLFVDVRVAVDEQLLPKCGVVIEDGQIQSAALEDLDPPLPKKVLNSILSEGRSI